MHRYQAIIRQPGNGSSACWPARFGNSCTESRDYGQMHSAYVVVCEY